MTTKSQPVPIARKQATKRAYAEYLAERRADGRLTAITWLEEGIELGIIDGSDIAIVMGAAALGEESNVEKYLEFENWPELWEELFDYTFEVGDFSERFTEFGLNDDAFYQTALGFVEGLIWWWKACGEQLCSLSDEQPTVRLAAA